MEHLRTYLNGLSVDEQANFADKCGTSVGYLRKALAVKSLIGINLCIEIQRHSKGAVRCEDLRPDIDWAYLRSIPAPPARTAA